MSGPTRIIGVESVLNEDDVYSASNLLDPSMTKRWLCSSSFAEDENRVVLRLEQPTKIEHLTVYNYNSTYIEVLVRNELEFESKVLIGLKMLMPPSGKIQQKERRFAAKDMTPAFAKQKWSRLEIRVKRSGTIKDNHLQFGLSSIAINVPPTKPKPTTIMQHSKVTISPRKTKPATAQRRRSLYATVATPTTTSASEHQLDRLITPTMASASKSTTSTSTLPQCPRGANCTDRGRLHRSSFTHPSGRTVLAATSLVTPARLRNVDDDSEEDDNDDNVVMPWQRSRSDRAKPAHKKTATRSGMQSFHALNRRRLEEQASEAYRMTATQRSPRRGRRRKSDMEEAPKCHCNRLCREATCTDDGPNNGKRYWHCWEDECSFRQFKAETKPKRSHRDALRGKRKQSSAAQSEQGQQGGKRIRCKKCGERAIRRRVKKDTINHGRYFYACPAKGCNYFVWEEAAQEDSDDDMLDNADAIDHATDTGLEPKVSEGESSRVDTVQQAALLDNDNDDDLLALLDDVPSSVHDGDLGTCPLCNKQLPLVTLEKHVNACLDGSADPDAIIVTSLTHMADHPSSATFRNKTKKKRQHAPVKLDFDFGFGESGGDVDDKDDGDDELPDFKMTRIQMQDSTTYDECDEVIEID